MRHSVLLKHLTGSNTWKINRNEKYQLIHWNFFEDGKITVTWSSMPINKMYSFEFITRRSKEVHFKNKPFFSWFKVFNIVFFHIRQVFFLSFRFAENPFPINCFIQILWFYFEEIIQIPKYHTRTKSTKKYQQKNEENPITKSYCWKIIWYCDENTYLK